MILPNITWLRPKGTPGRPVCRLRVFCGLWKEGVRPFSKARLTSTDSCAPRYVCIACLEHTCTNGLEDTVDRPCLDCIFQGCWLWSVFCIYQPCAVHLDPKLACELNKQLSGHRL